MTTCRYCHEPINRPGEYWVHSRTELYHCVPLDGPMAEPDLRIPAQIEEEKDGKF